jgi:hypothetical protein
VRFEKLGANFSDLLLDFKQVHRGALRWDGKHANRDERFWVGSVQLFQTVFQFCLVHFPREDITIVWGNSNSGEELRQLKFL